MGVQLTFFLAVPLMLSMRDGDALEVSSFDTFFLGLVRELGNILLLGIHPRISSVVVLVETV